MDLTNDYTTTATITDTTTETVNTIIDTTVNDIKNTGNHDSNKTNKQRRSNIIYIDINDFRKDNISISVTHNDKTDRDYYNVNYKYHDELSEELNIYIENVRLAYVSRFGKLQIYDKDPQYDMIMTTVNAVKMILIDYYKTNVQNLDESSMTKMININQKIDIHYKKHMNILKLGSKKEHNQNTHITTVEQISKLINNKHFNSPDSDKYYTSNIILTFSTGIYNNSTVSSRKETDSVSSAKQSDSDSSLSKSSSLSSLSRSSSMNSTNTNNVDDINQSDQTSTVVQTDQTSIIDIPATNYISFNPCARKLEIYFNKAKCVGTVDKNVKYAIVL